MEKINICIFGNYESISELRNLIKFLKENKQKDLIKDLKNHLLYYKDLYSINEILEFFIMENIEILSILNY